MLYYDKEHKTSCDGMLAVQQFESIVRPDLVRFSLCCTKCDSMFYAKDALSGWRKREIVADGTPFRHSLCLP